MLTFLQQAIRPKNIFSNSFPTTPILANILAYLATFVFLIIGNIVGSLLLFLVIFKKLKENGQGLESFQDALANPAKAGIDPNILFLWTLLVFVFTLFGLWAGVKVFHRRSIASMVNGLEKVRWSRFFVGFGVWFALTVGMEFVNYLLHPQDYQWTFEAVPFFTTLAIALFVLPFQTSCEEFIFRGWLMQGIGSAGLKPWVAIAVTGIMFGTLHFSNPEVAKFGLAPMSVYYIGFGVFLGLLTVLDDGMELALGLHFGNNFFGSTMVSFTSSALQTCTLMRTNDPDPYLLLGLSIVGAISAFFIFKKIYGFAPMEVLWSEPQIDLDYDADILKPIN